MPPCGVDAVVVGAAMTGPGIITRRFVEAIKE